MPIPKYNKKAWPSFKELIINIEPNNIKNIQLAANKNLLITVSSLFIIKQLNIHKERIISTYFMYLI